MITKWRERIPKLSTISSVLCLSNKSDASGTKCSVPPENEKSARELDKKRYIAFSTERRRRPYLAVCSESVLRRQFGKRTSPTVWGGILRQQFERRVSLPDRKAYLDARSGGAPHCQVKSEGCKLRRLHHFGPSEGKPISENNRLDVKML